MFSNKIRTWVLMALTSVLCFLIFSTASAGPPPVDQYALRDRDGNRIWEQLDDNDTITLNGHLYKAGPAYSPKATCGSCHDYDAITRAYHFREGSGPNGEILSDTWSSENSGGTLYRYLANAYGHLESPGQYGAW